MRLKDRPIALLLIFLVFSSGFMTLCHSNEGHILEVHLIAESCETHECGRNSQTPSCSRENCQHKICSDQSIIEKYLPNSSIQLETFAPPPALIIEDLSVSDKQTKPPASLQSSPHNSALRSTILRI